MVDWYGPENTNDQRLRELIDHLTDRILENRHALEQQAVQIAQLRSDARATPS